MSLTPDDDSAQADNYVPTDHDRVVYEATTDKYGRGELAVAKAVAEAVDDYTVVISMGPYRGYNVHYDTDVENKTIELDFYSASPQRGYSAAEVIADIKAGITIQSGAETFDDLVDLLDSIGTPNDWAVRFALAGDKQTLQDGANVWCGSPDEIEDMYVHVGLDERAASYKLTADGAGEMVRDALQLES
ncbi:hypothetical protein [Halobacterium yunchengense]|uniref:hypothetical protein n=1 Tax=Halobacterium yunchengense TaxID=3108497 RepID=UPI00300B8153